MNDAPLCIDPARRSMHEATGVYVRAKDGERWVNADVAELDNDSLRRFLARSPALSRLAEAWDEGWVQGATDVEHNGWEAHDLSKAPHPSNPYRPNSR